MTSDYPIIDELFEFVHAFTRFYSGVVGDNRKLKRSVSHNPSSTVSHKGKTEGG